MLELCFYCCHIYFKDGASTPFWEKILPNVIGAIITGLVTIWIFYQNDKRNKAKEKEAEKRRLIELEGRINNIIESLFPAIDEQIESFASFCRSLRTISKILPFNRMALIASLVDNFFEEAHSDLYKIYIVNRTQEMRVKSNAFNILMKNFYILKNIYDDSVVFIEKSMKVLNAQYQSWTDSINSIFRIFDRCVQVAMENNANLNDDLFLNRLNVLCRQFQDNQHRVNDIYEVRETFLNPLRQLCNEYRADPRTIDIILAISEVRTSESGIIRARYSILKYLISRVRNLKRAKEELGGVLRNVG